MDLDPILLSRIQFAFVVSFHILFPAFTIGLASYIAVLETLWAATDREVYGRLSRFWTKIFAVSFGMGVVSGIVMSFQFGTNWSRFADTTAAVIGPLLSYEVLTAFFLEATFLGILLFGRDRVSRPLHVLASYMVALGTLFSAFWILSANSWMQFPTGHEVRDGIAYPVDWLAIVFSPTFPLRLAHMVAAAYLTTAIVVLAVGARYLLAGVHERHGRTMIGMGLGMTLILAPLQAVIGDAHGLKTAEYQPVKLAAIEGHWPEREVAPLVLFGWPNERTETNDFQIAIPHLGSLIITHDWNGVYPGLKAFPPEDRPPVAPVFFSFRVMVGLGFFMIGLAFWGGYLWLRGQLFTSRPFLRIASWSWPTGFVAIIAGWFVAEIGRQPWVATGILRTVDASSPVAPATVAVTLALFVVVYGIVFTMGIRYINRLIVKGPAPEVAVEPKGLPNRPLSAAEEAARAAMQPGP